ncbi:hypothetical protein [uncultured Cohaesibacter sp.]|uniref:hypothetical protein n=1 Tax=uncultured Cohaesibacter sp. TaxID=1002546 RepID=UPI00292E6A82|nr:hypothetical protein [uncultured Cohaesibacter sp.]
MAYYVRQEITTLEQMTIAPEQVPPSLDEAYRLVRERAEKEDFNIVAWKLGGTTAPAQKAMKIDTLFFAPISQKELVAAEGLVPGYEVMGLKTEGEIALRLSQKGAALVEAGADAVRAAALDELFDGWCYALEMPFATIANAGDFGVIGIVLDRCAATCLAVGKTQEYDAATSWGATPLSLEQDGKEIATGSTDELIDSADEVARAFLLEALKHGFEPKVGQWISTGGMIPATVLEKGASVVMKAGGEVVLEVKTGWE